MRPDARSLPSHPSLRHVKLEAKRRLAAGEFATLHDAQAAIAREHGLPSWARLKQACAAQNGAAVNGPALGHLRWIVERFSGADGPGSACYGRERLAVDRSYATGELAALPADPGAAGTTNADVTPTRGRPRVYHHF